MRDAELERLDQLRKLCGRCRESKPWSAYWAVAKWPDGSMRRPQAWCKDCVKARRRERRRSEPEWAREQNRKDWARIQGDPEKAARRRETQRENSRVFRLRHGLLARHA